MSFIRKRLQYYIGHYSLYGRAIGKWLLLAVVIGVLSGLLGSAFHIGVEKATAFRLSHPWILYALPGVGLLIVAIYKLFHTEGQGTNDVISEVQSGEGLVLRLLPSVFFATILTHLAGGSAGREGAALQMGGSLGYSVGRWGHLDDRDMRTATMAGMAAFFAALFGTPLAATVFAMGVISVGLMYYAAFIPCLVASLTAYGVSLLLGVEPTRFTTVFPAVSLPMMLRVAVLSALCAFVSILFCSVLHHAEACMEKYLKNPWLRILAGGAVLVGLSLVFSSGRYNGAGMNIITAAVQEGQALPWDFLLKILFTGITRSGSFDFRGCHLWLRRRTPAGYSGRICRSTWTGGRILCRSELPGRVDLPGSGTVRCRRPALLCACLRPGLCTVRVRRAVFEPEDSV